MPTTKKVSVEHVGILAGGGALPKYLIESCKKKGVEVFVIGFKGQTNPETLAGIDHMWTGLGSAGLILKTLKQKNIQDLVMIGSIKRPSISELNPDFKALEILARIGFKALGDDGLLSAIKQELEKEGFTLHGVQDFSENLITTQGTLGNIDPDEKDWESIRLGVQVSQTLGKLDIGQAVIIQEGTILGLEAIEGTDELIKRCIPLKKQGNGPILVKTCKPQQDRKLDLPTIGPQTIQNAYNAGLRGIAMHSGASIILDPQKVAELADAYRIFVVGVKTDIIPI